MTVRVDNTEHVRNHHGIGPVQACTATLAEFGIHIDVVSLNQTSLSTGNDSDALTLLKYRNADGTHWAAGRDQSVLTATLTAVANAARRTAAKQAPIG
ncbi:alpha-isopropylmalate synthase regulatory domain-containing protein [Streptantibioticus rubrisoli]|uniref:2-isopropylmalate synthase LeuA allosteric (dimerisation) domain-containing protein n=1 Tax=Streptantibioticus rubrisoli TaxID=1387313 RepID=A0ABT1PBJ3_9ACTN|nr:alpha-isopropylmalate synthase regulatory domain-containing protein [Streptantibioticus rubrisoli]MCQ4042747.1 hypothetical protein [Streptantibioticus rubrisoli]